MRAVLLPGLGADNNLFSRLNLGEALLTPDLPEPKPDESLERYLRRLYELLPLTPAERSGEIIFGGISFGGQLALTLASLFPSRGVLLISSNRTRDTIPLRFKVNAAVGALVPDSLMPLLLRSLVPVFSLIERLSEPDRILLGEIATRTSIPALRWGVARALEWSERELTVPVHQIHGAGDLVIPLRGAGENTVILQARHLLPLTHPRELSEWIAARLKESSC